MEGRAISTGHLNGRVALVTGGGRGIGRGISTVLASAGASVAVNYRRDRDSAEQTVEEIRAAGGTAAAYQASVDVLEEDQAMVDRVVADFGFIDILVNNAGIASRGRLVVDTDPAELHRLVATHAFGAFYLSQLVIPLMRARPRGDIVMISSQATAFMPGRSAPYNMAKAALEALGSTLAKEEATQGIRVNVVAAGLVDTEMGRRLVRAREGVHDIHELGGSFPFGRVTEPLDIAHAVVFLVSSTGEQVTGQRLGIDGGHVALPLR